MKDVSPLPRLEPLSYPCSWQYQADLVRPGPEGDGADRVPAAAEEAVTFLKGRQVGHSEPEIAMGICRSRTNLDPLVSTVPRSRQRVVDWQHHRILWLVRGQGLESAEAGTVEVEEGREIGAVAVGENLDGQVEFAIS